MILSYQSAEGHTTLTDLTDEQVKEKFEEMTSRGYRGFAGTTLANASGPVRSFEEAAASGATEIYMIAPLIGG